MRIARFEPRSYIDLLNRDLGYGVARGDATGWTPAVDIIEEKQGFLLRADLPGVSPADIDVPMDAAGITARTHNGILEVAIPKLPRANARRITVEAA